MPNGLLIFLAYVVLEVYVLIQATVVWGGWNVLFALLFSFATGAFILQYNRHKIMTGLSGNVGSVVFSSIAGVLFMVPGFVSDVVAVLFLLPPVQRYFSKVSDKFFMRQGFNHLFRFGYFGQAGPKGGAGQNEPEFREDIKVTVVDRDGAHSTEHVTRRRKLDDSNIIDVEVSKDDENKNEG